MQEKTLEDYFKAAEAVKAAEPLRIEAERIAREEHYRRMIEDKRQEVQYVTETVLPLLRTIMDEAAGYATKLGRKLNYKWEEDKQDIVFVGRFSVWTSNGKNYGLTFRTDQRVQYKTANGQHELRVTRNFGRQDMTAFVGGVIQYGLAA